jgi:hypothetical protein
VQITVNKATPTPSLTSSLKSAVAGAPFTFTATLTGTGAKPTGSVTFLDGGTVVGSGALNSSGVAIFTTGSLSAGKHSITVSYPGDGNYLAVPGASLTITIL